MTTGPRMVECDPLSPVAQHCLERYYAELNQRFTHGFIVNRSHDPDASLLRRPRGVFIVALVDEAPVGCVALKGTGPAYSEIKRMWVDPTMRGTGLAAQLMQAAEAAARELGPQLLRLDTNVALSNAIAIYRHWGWREIERYNDDPYAEVFFEKAL